MNYKHINLEGQIAIIENRLRSLEEEHWNHELNLERAKVLVAAEKDEQLKERLNAELLSIQRNLKIIESAHATDNKKLAEVKVKQKKTTPRKGGKKNADTT